MVTKRYKLTAVHKSDIAQVFKRHQVSINATYDLNWLYARIEAAWTEWESQKEEREQHRIGRQDMCSEIKRLRLALKLLNKSTRQVLICCSLATEIYKQLEMKGAITKLLVETFGSNFTSGNGKPTNMLDVACTLLSETCALAETGGGQSQFGGKDTVDDYVTKRGRPDVLADVGLTAQMMSYYLSATNKKPTQTENGPFEDLLLTVFRAIDPVRADDQDSVDSVRHLIRKVSNWPNGLSKQAGQFVAYIPPTFVI
ncbi:MAG: hypothetical protein WCL44_02480 [bacterium]